MRAKVLLTANFDRNLQSIRSFLEQCEAGDLFEKLLDLLFDQIIPNLQQFPHMGRNFLDTQPQSTEGQARHKRLSKLVARGTEIRQYISGDYLLLYSLAESTIHLLAMRHHRQLSFDLRGHWN